MSGTVPTIASGDSEGTVEEDERGCGQGRSRFVNMTLRPEKVEGRPFRDVSSVWVCKLMHTLSPHMCDGTPGAVVAVVLVPDGAKS